MTAALGAAGASAAQLAVVAETGSNHVSLINAATNKPIAPSIEAGDGPTSVAITPDGKFAYVTDSNGESVTVIETGLRRKVTTIEKVGKNPYGIAITPNGEYAYVTDRGSGEVAVISTATNKVVKSIRVGEEPTGIAISPSGKVAYVADFGDDQVEVISTESMAVTGEPIEAGDGPMGIEFTAGTAYVVDELGKEGRAIDTLSREVTKIPLPEAGGGPSGIAISPDGTEAYAVGAGTGAVLVIDTGTNHFTKEIAVSGVPREVALSANGKVLYVTESAPSQVEALNAQTGNALPESPIALPGTEASGIALTPDQSPTAAFTPPSATVGVAAPFNGSASTDPDGTITSYAWTFEDGRDATGVSAVHTFAAAGTFKATLSVTDNEGCGAAMVFTGRTAYCSGGESTVTHPVAVKAAPVVEPSVPVCKSNFGVGGVSHNRKNGTARLRVKLHTPGSIFLFGKKVHAVSRKTKTAGTMVLTIHARVELNKRLKTIHRAPVAVRITFTPSDGCGYRTVHRSFPLLRAKKKHHRH